jgi:hypothetical protein
LPNFQTIQREIQARIAELEKLIEPLRLEAELLAKIAAVLDDRSAGHTPHTMSRATASGKTKIRGAPAKSGHTRPGRSLSGSRAQQATAKIARSPGITASELAESMAIAPNYLYRILPRLEREAKVTKRGKGYHPVSDSDWETPDGPPAARRGLPGDGDTEY